MAKARLRSRNTSLWTVDIEGLPGRCCRKNQYSG